MTFKIKFANPEKGKREHLFSGDEARVFRIRSGRFKDLVERVQPFDQRQSPAFSERKGLLETMISPDFGFCFPGFNMFVKIGDDLDNRVTSELTPFSTETTYHILKPMALMLGKSMC
jgi:hypothetical protein